MSESEFTVGDLRRHLQGWDENTPLTFGGGLTFYRFKGDDDGIFLEFGEPQAYLDGDFRRSNPHIKVAFVSTDAAAWNEDGLLSGPVDVSIR